MYKIMLVEDDKNISKLIKKSIEAWDFNCAVVSDFENVVDEFIKLEPHLVLMDINLPTYNGFYWCEKIRKLSKVPIIFISSRSTNMDIVMAVNMGGDDYIIKPFSTEVLIAKMSALLRRTYSYYAQTDLEVIEHNGAILNLKDSTFSWNENVIELTKNEFKIIYILMKNHGAIISRDKLMKELWEDENFVDDNTLTVNINRLRKKLKEMGLDNFVETKKNQGYIVA
jgi:DNA-binding response OmpR family regulator